MREIDERAKRMRRGYVNAAGNTFGLLQAKPRESEAGWHMAALVDGDFAGWLCHHAHRTEADAAACERTEPPTGHTVVTRHAG